MIPPVQIWRKTAQYCATAEGKSEGLADSLAITWKNVISLGRISLMVWPGDNATVGRR